MQSPPSKRRAPQRAGRASAELASWLAMSDFGTIRRLPRGAIYLEFPGLKKQKRRIWTMRVGDDATIPFTEETARRVLEGVRHAVARGRDLDAAIAIFLPYNAPENLIRSKLDGWIAVKRAEVESGDRSPTYVGELERYVRRGGHFSFWDEVSIHGITYASLEDWSLWLARRGLSPKTRWNVIGAFRSFTGWLVRRGELTELPRDWPWPKVPEPSPRVLVAAAQNTLLDAIPERDRGVFLAMARMGIRPGEAVAITPADLADGWITIHRARKGKRLTDPVRSTKSGRPKRLPVPDDVLEWIAANVEPAARLRGEPLFKNPRTGKPWAATSLRRVWEKACAEIGAPPISIYEGTKHSFATDAMLRGVPERALQAYLGHADVRSTRRYARLADQALVDVIRRRP